MNLVAFGKRTAPGVRGTYVTHAIAEDEVVHFAELTVSGVVDGQLTEDDLVLFLPCRRLVIDGRANALAHLRRPEVSVDCMTCLVKQWSR